MKISPCGWYCFDEPAGFVASDTVESILLQHPPTGAIVEFTSARKEHKIRNSEIWDMLEDCFTPQDGASFEETAMIRNEAGLDCLKSIVAHEGQVKGIAFVFWTHYCVQIRFFSNSTIDRTPYLLRSFDSLINSIQALTLE